jgi:hypothetical protein
LEFVSEKNETERTEAFKLLAAAPHCSRHRPPWASSEKMVFRERAESKKRVRERKQRSK